MIVIFSEEDDYTTYEVIKWLKFFNKKYILYNTISGKEHLYLDFELEYDNEIKLKINNCENISSIWFSRARVNIEPFYLEKNLDPELIKFVNNFTREENLHLSYYVKSSC